MCEVGGMDIVEAMDVSARLREVRRTRTPRRTRPSVLAFYLPQYHQDPDNDEFWGEGFTDWDNVRSAMPLFAGHRQPIDRPHRSATTTSAIRRRAVPRRPAQMAAAGIDGGVMYHYWFNGRKVLRHAAEEPARLTRRSRCRFALCWANEPWTRRWDGLDDDVLISQDLTRGWEHRFYDDIRSALFDPRYITVQGKPLLLVYRLDLVPDLPGGREGVAAPGAGGRPARPARARRAAVPRLRRGRGRVAGRTRRAGRFPARQRA